MSIKDLQPSFSGGELSPSLHNRTDLAKYHIGLKTCRNTIIHSHGGASNRAGLKFAGETTDSTKRARLIPFAFNTEQTYALEFGNLTMRVIKDGAYVLEAAQNITNITQANPAVVTITSHGYSNGDEVYITGVVGMTEVNGKRFTVANVAANTFELSGIDSTGYTAYSSGGTAARYYTVTTPYVEADLSLLKYTQSADVMTLTHPGYAPRKLSRTGHTSWTLSTITFATAIAAPTGVALGTVGTASGSNNKTYEYVVTAVDAAGNESVASSAVNHNINAMSVTYGTRVTWTAVTGADYYRIYKAESFSANVYGWIGDCETTTFEDFNIGPDMTDSPPLANNPFGSTDNYPGCVVYHQQRLFFGRTNNDRQTIWGTKTGLYDNMDYSRPSRADDSVVFTIAARQVNEIRHLVPISDMIVMTSGGEWKASGGSASDAITPASITIRPQGFRGSSDVPPVVVGNTVLFVQDKGNIVRDLAYTFDSDSYSGNDLTVLSSHLFEGYTITDWAFSQAPHSILWVVRDDGKMLGLTYLREHEVWAWHWHETAGDVESVCSISEGDEDAVYVIVKRKINGTYKRYVERMSTRVIDDVRDCFFVDSGLTLDNPVAISGATQANPVVVTATAHGFSNGDLIDISDIIGMTEINDTRYKIANVTANTFELTDEYTGANIDGTGFTAYESGGNARKAVTSITGLDHLEGETVSILANGNVEPSQVVTNGAITLTKAASRVHVGLQYISDIETLDIDLQGRNVSTTGKKITVSDIIVKVFKTRGLWAGPDADSLTEWKQRGLAGESYNDPTALHTGSASLAVKSRWRDGGGVFLRQQYPLPMSVLSIIPRVSVGG